jgi:hypothetical protein
LECHTPGESLDILRDLALSHALDGGQEGKKIARLIRRERFSELCEYELDYNAAGHTAATLIHCRQALAFFSKLENLEIGVDKEWVAWRKFEQAEDDCRETNRLLRLWQRGEVSFPPRVETWFFKAQRKIAQVLGPVPKLEELGFRFGKGATTLTRKRGASLREKFRAGFSCSEELFPMAKAILEELPVLADVTATMSRVDEDGEEWLLVPIHIHDGKLDFVPKNAKTYRAVVAEPVLNGLIQLALGDHMTRRLAAFGVDLRDQTRNQRLALMGSVSNDLATLDLSSASDTISKELVFHLLPLEWASLLARARTGHILYKGKRLTLEKFSSMGNGFTFPLESLIFWALTRAVCSADDEVSVYGDDIICPSARYHEVVELLKFSGFTVNEKKSFHNGPFRESCGCDYFRGIDIRPYYQKDWVSPRTLFILHNHYVRAYDDERAKNVLRFIHPSLHLYGPDGYGDGHLLGSYNPGRRLRHYRSGYAGHIFNTFTPKGRKDIRPALPGDCVLPSYSIYQRSADPLLDDPLQLLLSKLQRQRWDVAVCSEATEPKLDTGGRHLPFQPALRALIRGHGSLEGTLPIPDEKLRDGTVVKAVSLPGTEETYKMISIYTLGV